MISNVIEPSSLKESSTAHIKPVFYLKVDSKNNEDVAAEKHMMQIDKSTDTENNNQNMIDEMKRCLSHLIDMTLQDHVTYSNRLSHISQEEYDLKRNNIKTMYQAFLTLRSQNDIAGALTNKKIINKLRNDIGNFNKHTYKSKDELQYLEKSKTLIDELMHISYCLLRNRNNCELTASKLRQMYEDVCVLKKNLDKATSVQVCLTNTKKTKNKQSGSVQSRPFLGYDSIFIQYDTQFGSQKNNQLSNKLQCPVCLDSEVLLHDQQATMVCTKCGQVLDNKVQRVTSVKDVYRYQSRTDVNFSINYGGQTYKRLNHLRECMRQLQGLTIHSVPQKVIDKVKQHMKLNRMVAATMTPTCVRDLLKACHENKQYEHSVSICAAINKTFKPLKIPKKQIVEMSMMFIRLENVFQEAMAAVQPKRKNFLSYHYVLFRLAQLLGFEDKLKHSIRMLKSSKLLQKQDIMWKKMCSCLKWQYAGDMGFFLAK